MFALKQRPLPVERNTQMNGSPHQNSPDEVFKILSDKLPISQKLRNFRGNSFLQCVLLSTALHCSLPEAIFLLFANSYFLVKNYQ